MSLFNLKKKSDPKKELEKQKKKVVKSTDLARAYVIPIENYKRKPGDLKVDVQVIAAKNLYQADLITKSNPYVCLYVLSEVYPRAKTKVIKNTLHPTWNQRLEVDVENFKKTQKNMTLRVEVYDWSLVGVHQFLGCHTIYIRDHANLRDTTGKWVELWLVLKKRTSKDKVSGKIHLGIKIDAPPDDDSIAELVKMKERQSQRVRPKSTAVSEIPTSIDFEVGGIGIVDGKPKRNRGVEFDINPVILGKDFNPLDKENWTVQLKSPEGDEIPIQFIPDEKTGRMKVKYTPKQIGPYQISVSQKGGKPQVFDVNVFPEPDAKKCLMHRKLLGESDRIPLQDKEVVYTVISKDELGNPLHVGGDEIDVEIDGPVETKARVVDNQNGSYDVSFVPVKGGKYSLGVKINGEPLGEPIGILVNSDVDPQNCIFKGDGIDKTPVLFTPNTIEIQLTEKDGKPKKTGGDEFEPIIISPSGEEIPVYFNDNEDGTYQICYVPEEPGDYKLKLKVNNKEIKPKELNVGVVSDPRKTTVAGPVLKGGDLIRGVHIPCVMKIQARDQKGLKREGGGDKIDAIVTFDGDDEVERLPVNVKDNDDGTYTISFKPTSAGPHNLDISMNGSKISPKPFTIPITEDIDLENTTVDGPGTKKAYTNIAAPLDVQGRDPDCVPVNFDTTDLFDVLVTDTDKIDDSVPVVKKPYLGEGKTPVLYTPKKEGLHKIQVLNKGKKVIEPFSVVVLPNDKAPEPLNTVLVDPPSKVTVFEPIEFDIELKDKNGEPIPTGNDDVDVIVDDPDGKVTEVKPKLVDHGNGTYTVKYLPTDVGKHNVRVKVLGKDIKTKPLIVDVIEAINDDVPVIISRYVDLVLYNKKGQIIKKETKDKKLLDVYFVDKSTGKKTNKVVSSRKFFGDGKYRFTYLTKETGEFTVNILMNENHIPGSPFKLDVLS